MPALVGNQACAQSLKPCHAIGVCRVLYRYHYDVASQGRPFCLAGPFEIAKPGPWGGAFPPPIETYDWQVSACTFTCTVTW